MLAILGWKPDPEHKKRVELPPPTYTLAIRGDV
jgi:hypothetical protein